MTAASPSSQRLPMHTHRKGASPLSIRTILGCIALSLASFYSGLMLGLHSMDQKCHACLRDTDAVKNYMEKAEQDILAALQKDSTFARGNLNKAKNDLLQAMEHDKVTPSMIGKVRSELMDAIHKSSQKELIPPPTVEEKPTEASVKPERILPKTMRYLFNGMARIQRDAFFDKFDVGVPMDDSNDGNEEVLMLYSSPGALPSMTDNTQLPLLNVENATENCNTVKVVFTQNGQQRECLALVGQWESYHVHKFMRLPLDGTKKRGENRGVDKDLPFRYVSRLHSSTNGLVQRVPTPQKVKEYNQILVEYLSGLDGVLGKLKPLAQKVAKDNTIVVMVCNHGQSELLMNFACSSQSRGFDLSQVLVFATDTETKELAEGLGMTAFYDEKTFGAIPKEHAGYYADDDFAKIMMAKLYCVHMVNLLGYDLLFQDADVVWYRNPLEFFSDSTSKYYDFDIYFQDDGARTIRYTPYSPNSGFYFVRHNARTEYFMHSLLMAGAIILQSGSHQNAMSAVLNEHASWRGLHVKTLNRNMPEFLSGYEYNMATDLVNDFVEGRTKPYIFHMSWTGNKDDKKKYFEQMGDWYVKEECVGSTASKIRKADDDDLGKACCVANPTVTCHYRDRPSKTPCKDSPPMDKGGKSWW